MFLSFFGSALTQTQMLLVTRDPGMVAPIAKVLGIVYNALFNFIYSFVQSGSLGIAIILFTLLVKLILTPLIFKQQQSTFKMQKLQPEMNRIKEKYAKKKDPESQQKMAYELQEFQKKNGISLMGGCLPLLIQLPILYALFYIFQQAYMYVDVVNQNYTNIANVILQVPYDDRMNIFTPYALTIANALKRDVFLTQIPDIMRIVNELNLADWQTVLGQVGTDIAAQLEPLLMQKNQIEYFLGIHMVYKTGLGFPGIIIPIASAFSTWLSSRMMMKNQPMDASNPAMGSMKMMNTVMPIMMGVMTISVPAGLGVYWTVSNIFQLGQQWLIQKYFKQKDKREAA